MRSFNLYESKNEQRETNEFEHVRTDRIELAVQANTLINTFVAKQVAPTFSGSYVSPLELEEYELTAYKAALNYLAKQFDAGPAAPLAAPKKCEKVCTVEYSPIKPEGEQNAK